MAETSPRLRIGLTGGIGSGKSTVAAMLGARGAEVVDTDLIARRMSAPGGTAIGAIRLAFGENVIDATGALDRARMRAIAFTDADAKARLEAILHPLIGQEAECQAAASCATVVVFDVPLLVESGRWAARVDRVWVVDCSESTQAARVLTRPGWSVEAVHAVMGQQASRVQRRAHADAIIYNEGIGLATLGAQVDALCQETLALLR